MRIIRISGCHDCDPYKNYGTYCGKDRAISIHYHVFHKTLPDNCPLEEFTKNEAFDFLDGESRHFGEEGEDIYTGTEGELITFTNKDG
ncbi:hypothetical protein LCGC14_2985080 [marine sediment metagenome]|uniref:Uncharacterized protein n=1 Tax=marine sediment metagenome TaxID=412755 RepID=A0A0F8ZCZ8_9ZZZZ